MNIFKLVILIYILYLPNLLGLQNKDLYVLEDTNEVVNFYVTGDKLYLSGLSISGTYLILTKYISHILALNMSNIGEESGIEVILLDLNKKILLLGLVYLIQKNHLIEIKGNCK